jgi:hypothetical protein
MENAELQRSRIGQRFVAHGGEGKGLAVIAGARSPLGS